MPVREGNRLLLKVVLFLPSRYRDSDRASTWSGNRSHLLGACTDPHRLLVISLSVNNHTEESRLISPNNSEKENRHPPGSLGYQDDTIGSNLPTVSGCARDQTNQHRVISCGVRSTTAGTICGERLPATADPLRDDVTNVTAVDVEGEGR